ncbi:MAG: magnesium transporter CorA family protein [Candidatus Buchananbacteria bacterium]
MSNLQKIEFENFTWISVANPSEAELTKLAQTYKFHPLDLADCLSTNQRTKIDIYPRYSFLVFRVPVYNRKTREILPAEMNIFISKNFLITIHHNDLPIFSDFFGLMQLSNDSREKYNEKSPEKILYEIINKLFLYCFPMIDHLNIDCNNIEKAIFSGKEKEMVSEILIIRRNITDFRKIMQVHKTVLKKAIYNFKESPLFVMKKTDIYFESLLDSAKEIWDTLENLKETIEALQQTNESQISFKLSDTMRILTIISVFTFPLTLIAAIFGMNTIASMPLVNNQLGFWYIIGLMALIWLIMAAVFKKKDWL